MPNTNNKKIPEGAVSRVFVYLREMVELEKSGIRTISSAELGEKVNLSDAQVRKDLGYFGQFGVTGSGYDVRELKMRLEKILGKDRTWNVAVIGAGHLGSALVAYPGFKAHGLEVVACFDIDKSKIGKSIGTISVQGLEDLKATVKDKNISIGIIAVPARDAQAVADALIRNGIKHMLNFAPAPLNIPEDVKVSDVDLSRELETLSYFLASKNSLR